MDEIYGTYLEAIKTQLGKEELTFKSDPNYQYVLEHSNFGHEGSQYLMLIKNEFNLTPDEIMLFTRLNDSFGKPELVNYDTISPCSPTSLRYVYHAHLILKYMQSIGIKNPSIVEVGGGYAGLCMALHMYAEKFGITPRTYSIIDLEAPGKLQRRVLDMNGYSSVTCHDAEKFGADIDQCDSFLISAYAFTEFTEDLRRQYMNILFPKITHGFIVWNAVTVHDIGKTVRFEDERPRLNSTNKFCYF